MGRREGEDDGEDRRRCNRGSGESCHCCLCASDLVLKFARVSERLETSIGDMMVLGDVEGGPVFTMSPTSITTS